MHETSIGKNKCESRPPRVAFFTLGCKVNQVETASWQERFHNAGYCLVDFTEPADVYIINTCTVTGLSSRKSRQIISRTVAKKPAGAIVAAVGCWVQTEPEAAAAIKGVALLVGAQDKHYLLDLVEKVRANLPQSNKTPIRFKLCATNDKRWGNWSLPIGDGSHTRAFVKIQDGCDAGCTYCIVPYARGSSRSREASEVISEIEQLLSKGFSEIVLTGIHLGVYGRDISAVSLTDLCKNVLMLPGLIRLRLGSLEANEVDDELLLLMKNDQRFCRHLHLPLQSGDDTVLSRMGRRGLTADFLKKVTKIRQAIPEIAITSDVIVGFPGETESQFKNTLDFIDEIKFAQLHVFPYSRRPGTVAANFIGQLPNAVKKKRSALIREQARKLTQQYNEQFIGRVVEVLLEYQQAGIWYGLTNNYIRVSAVLEGDLRGKVVPLELITATDYGMMGMGLES